MEEDRIRIPGAGFNLIESEHDWAYECTMVDRDDCRRTENTRGKVLGGSSCLNYFAWMRGCRGTYEEWAKFGGKECSFDQFFRIPPRYIDPTFGSRALCVVLND